MERYEIETFLTLADELHFARTAERLRVSPGRVSQTIKALERQIGGALFERSSRSVTLTSVGRQLRDDLLPAREQIQRALSNARDACAQVSGVLRIGFTTPWTGDLLVRAGDVFATRYPRCAVELSNMTYSAAVAALRAKQVDLLIAEPPVEEPDVVVGPVLLSERRALVVSTAHRLAKQETVSLEDLALLPLVMAAGVSPAWRKEFYPSRTPGGRRVEPGPTAHGWEGVLSLVDAGKGATVAAARAGTYHARPGIAYVPFEDAGPVEYALMWRDEPRSAGVQALIRTILDCVRPSP